MQRYKKNVNREQSKVKNFICSYLSCTVRSIWGTSKSSSQPYMSLTCPCGIDDAHSIASEYTLSHRNYEHQISLLSCVFIF